MLEPKKKRLIKKGWRFGTAREFLNLSEEESAYIEVKLKLAHAFRDKRRGKGLTQEDAAHILRSSQSRVAKMEAGDPSVSVDLLIRALFSMGSTAREVGRIVGEARRAAQL